MHLAELQDINRKNEKVLSKKLFFISGVPKSGTTWLQKSLDSHPEITCSGEGHFFTIFGDFLKQSMNVYNSKVLDVAAAQVYEGNPGYKNMTDNDLNFLVTSFISVMFSKLEIKETSNYIGDKTPANAMVLDHMHSIFPEAKFIHIYRDGRDVVVSTYRHGTRVTGRPGVFQNSIEPTAKKWLDYNKIAFEFGRKHPNAFLAVSYEQLIQDFPAHFSDILKFLGADNSESMVHACKDLSSFEKLSGGRKRGEEDRNSFYRKGVVGDWKIYFSDEDLKFFNRIGGDMMKELGYEE